MRNLRSAVMLLLTIGLVAMYLTLMKLYLHGLDKPLLLEVGFLASFVFACSYEIKGVSWTYAAIGCLTTSFVYAIGMWMAIWLRAEYASFVLDMKESAEFAAFVGRDLYEAMSARVVGFGGCFALGVLLVRFVLARVARKCFIAMFVPRVERPAPCPCCGQFVAAPVSTSI